MNPYTLDLLPEAEDDLTAIWLNSSDRAAVTRAQAQADRLLARDPYGNGRFVSEDLYQLDCPPLAISYTIDDGQRVVEIQAVREIVS